ncbi:MAG: PrsW family intramembrane metalloprotease [Chloroflexi bacterium]|nr:PrsW family intramembrane metalloprotease [Chloroflexota bacterium]
MPGIYVMAVITLLVSAALWGGLLYVLPGRTKRYLWLLLPGLPLSALVNLGVKRPLAVMAGQMAGVAPKLGLETPWWFILFLFLLAPVFEEAVKVVPLLLPQVRRLLVSSAAALWVGMALGISFGLGEAAYLAYGIAQSPQYAALPWYIFTGYFGERLVVCFVHGVMTAVVVTGLQHGKGRGMIGYLAAVGLHTLVNLGAVFFQLGLIPAWGAQLALLLPILLLAAIFERLRRDIARGSDGPDSADEIVYFRRGQEEQLSGY